MVHQGAAILRLLNILGNTNMCAAYRQMSRRFEQFELSNRKCSLVNSERTGYS